MRGAAMGLTAAAARGVVVLLLSMPVIQSQSYWAVTYTSTNICALQGSTVQLHCTYRHPSTVNVERTLWFTKWRYSAPVDLRDDPEYAGRVQYGCQEKSCTLTITDLKESDAAEYKFWFKTNQVHGWYTSHNGVTLKVTGLQVSAPDYWTRLITCHSSCVPDSPSYIWYRNGEKVQGSQKSSIYANFDATDSYICALEGHEDLHSPSACSDERSCNTVTYTDRSICALKGSSVDISSTYSSSGSITSKLWFSPERSGQWVHQSRPQDLSEDPQYAGRVQVLETEAGRSTVRISELTERDSAQYHFTFTAGSFEWRSSLPGTALTVTALQVQVTTATVHQLYTEAELKCLSSCSPAARLSFVWFKNGQKIMTEETSSYKDNFYPGDDVSCAFRGREDYRSPPVYAPRLPSVSVSPSAEIVEGSSVTLTCSSDANPAANYTWYKEDQDSPAASGQIFTITDFRSNHSGNYYCEARNKIGHHNNTLYLALADTWTGAAAGITAGTTTAAVLAAVILLFVFLLIRKKRAPQPPCEPGQRADSREQHHLTSQRQPEEQDSLHYASVQVSRNCVYSDCSPAEEEAVEYTSVRFDKSSRAPRSQASAEEDLTALYSTINKAR